MNLPTTFFGLIFRWSKLIRVDRSVLKEDEKRGQKEWASCSALRTYFSGGEVRIFGFYNNKQTNKTKNKHEIL